MPPTSSILNRLIEQWSVECVNQRISLLSLPSVGELTRFDRQPYVYEHQGLSILAQFRLGCAGLGNKQPRFGALRLKRCPLCCQLLDEVHVAFTCLDLEKFRKFHTTITKFRILCTLKSMTIQATFNYFVNGLDSNGDAVSDSVYIERA